ncbi:MAG: NAD(P)-binding domain-containing protein [Acidimicrobiia bacterium]|nr:NAD(P)-binding domain-containing protein [Acidimicrobiia bacterium]
MNGTKRIAILGLGIMGTGIAQNFLKNDQTVIVWNRSVEKTKDLKIQGAQVANSIKAAVQKADIIFEVTANDE